MNIQVITIILMGLALIATLICADWLLTAYNKSLDNEIKIKKKVLLLVTSLKDGTEWNHKKLCDHFKLDEWSDL